MTSENRDIALFDFCETLVGFQSADRYVAYCLQQYPSLGRTCRHLLVRLMEKVRLFALLYKLNSQKPWHKQMVLWQLKGMTKDECERSADSYLSNQIFPALVQPVLSRLLYHKAKGDDIWIVSGGYDIYLNKFGEMYGINGVLSSKIGFKGGKCTGSLEGADCMKEAKVEYVRKLNLASYKQQYFYTDSSSDLPLLKMVNCPVVVSFQKSQNWAKKMHYNEIIWS